MIPRLSRAQKIQLLRRAEEAGLLVGEAAHPLPDPDGPTLSESDLLARFDALVAGGVLGPDFIQRELEAEEEHHLSPDEISGSSLDRLALLRQADPGHPEMMEAFPMPADGRYVPLAYLGDGGMGRVYKAYDLQLKRTVALKFLKHREPEAVERFLQEGRTQAQIDHPHVADIYSVGQVEGQPYLAMRFINGPTLRGALSQLNLEQKVRIIASVAEALHACHRLGFIHRDMKPSNIMLERAENGDWWPFVLDFGLARELGSQGHTVAGVVLGTPVYCSPEQVQGLPGRVDRRSDVYSLGATLYEVLCGEPPFPPQGTLIELARRIVEEDPPSLLRRVPALPKDLELICRKALEKESSHRYDSAKAMAEDLRRYLDGDPIQARHASLAYRLGKRLRKNKALSLVVGVSLLLILGLGSFGAATFLRARVTARSSQYFGREAEQLETLLSRAHALPLHDTRPTQALIAARLESLRAEIPKAGRWSEAAGRLALGRGYLALDQLEAARAELEQARRLAPQDAATAMSLGIVLARVFQQEMEGLRGKAREDRRKELEGSLLVPARDCLRVGEGIAPDRYAMASALLHLAEDRFDEALAQAERAAALAPWDFEGLLLMSDVHRVQASLALAKGEYAAVEARLDGARAAVRKAQSIARSAPAVYRAEVLVELVHMQMRTDQAKALKEDRDRALEAARLALQADPGDVRTLAALSAVHHRWSQTLTRTGQDPSGELALAIACAERAFEGRQDDAQLANALATALRALANWQADHGEDPREAARRGIVVLERGLKVGRFQDWLLNNLGLCWSVLGTHDARTGADPVPAFRNAQDAYTRAMAIKPWVGHANCKGINELEWARYLSQQGQEARPMLETAAKSFRAGLALNDQSWQCHWGLGEALAERLGLPDAPPEAAATAERHLRRAAELNPALKPECEALLRKLRR